jgi:hypothetical protein
MAHLESIEAICAYVADKAAETVVKDECPFSEVAVLYAKKAPADAASMPLPEWCVNLAFKHSRFPKTF